MFLRVVGDRYKDAVVYALSLSSSLPAVPIHSSSVTSVVAHFKSYMSAFHWNRAITSIYSVRIVPCGDFTRMFHTSCALRPKLHYTDTGYGHIIAYNTTNGHHQLTSSQQFYTLQQICHIAMPEPNISTCQDVGMWQIFVRWW